MQKLLTALVVGSVLSGAAWAEDNEAEKAWKASAEVGFIVTSGNTSTSSYSVKADVEHNMEDWRNEYKFDSLFKQDQLTDDEGNKYDERSVERYFASGQANYKLNDDKSSLFGYLSYLDDSSKSRSYNSQSTAAVGYGTQIYKTETMTMNVNIGPGYSWSELENGENQRGFIVRGKWDLDWAISDSASFSQAIAVETGGDNTQTKAETALMAKVNSKLQMKVGLVVLNNSQVAEGKKKTDTETTFTLVYNF